jgi:hypothetical protein
MNTLFCTLLLALAVRTAPAFGDDTLPLRHVRAENEALRALVEDGGRRSSTLSALIERLDRSDVFVYVEHQRLPPSLNARLTLLGASGGWRYVRVQLDCRGMLLEQMARLGHELRHAVEIADAPTAVGPTSVQDLYGRIGFPIDTSHERFETQDAIDAGRRVYQEVLSHTATLAAR